MANIHPFRAYRYSAKAGRADDLLTQPYDKITPQTQERYYKLSPYNFVRLSKGKEKVSDTKANNVYTRAAKTLDAWIAKGILEQESEPALFPYFQVFEHPETKETHTRKGFIGLTELVDYDARIVHRHELTHSGVKVDRLQLIRHTRAQLGQLFMLYDDPQHAIDAQLDQSTTTSPLISAEDEYGVRHSLWRIRDTQIISEIQETMSAKKLLIADGHHRYETALAYSKVNPNLPGADKVMMTFINIRSPGLVVLAGHRVLSGLADFHVGTFLNRVRKDFDVEAVGSAEELERRLRNMSATTAGVGVVMAGDSKSYLLAGRPEALASRLVEVSTAERMLDVVILHKVLITAMLGIAEEDVRELKTDIRYIRGFQNAVNEVWLGSAQIAFLLRPVEVLKMAEISFAGGVMPQKSTDFYPKLLSGLTVYRYG